jgi:hypothetical protein
LLVLCLNIIGLPENEGDQTHQPHLPSREKRFY